MSMYGTGNRFLLFEKSIRSTMETWKKGAIIGGIWGLVGTFFYSYITAFDPLYKKILFILFGLPTFIAITLKFHFILIFIGSIIIGIIIGAITGYLIKHK